MTIKRFMKIAMGMMALGFASNAAAQSEAIMATLAPPGSPAAPIHAEFLENFTAASTGAVAITPFFAGELGPEEKYFGDLRRGRVQLAVVSSHGISTAIPEFSMLRAPFLFDSVEEYAFIFETELKPVMNALLAEKGMVLFSWMISGWDALYARRPLLEPGDVEGVRLRIPIEPSAPIIFKTLKADIIQIPFTDVITGLQTGLIEAGETTPSAYLSSGIWTEAPDFTLTNHALTTAFSLANAGWFEGLPQQDQTALLSGYPSAIEIFERMSRDINDDLDTLTNQGRITLHRPSPSQRTAWRDAAAPALAQMVGVLGGKSEEILQAITRSKAAFQSQVEERSTE